MSGLTIGARVSIVHGLSDRNRPTLLSLTPA